MSLSLLDDGLMLAPSWNRLSMMHSVSLDKDEGGVVFGRCDCDHGGPSKEGMLMRIVHASCLAEQYVSPRDETGNKQLPPCGSKDNAWCGSKLAFSRSLFLWSAAVHRATVMALRSAANCNNSH
jgi:hypothetical protein